MRSDELLKSTLIQALDCAFDKRSWHGPNLTGTLRGVRATQARISRHGRKSIWQQALHAAYWKQRVLNKLAGTQRFPRKGSNWPQLPEDPTEAAWRADLLLLHDIQRRLRDAVLDLPAKELNEKAVWLIQGAAAHDLYHAGQISLLRKMLDI